MLVLHEITPYKLAEEARRQTEDRYSMLTDNPFVGMYIVQEGRFCYVNAPMTRALGYGAEDIVGKMGPLDLVHPDDRPMVEEYVRRRLAGEEVPSAYTCKIMHKDGSFNRCQIYNRFIDYGGRPAFVGMALDVTEQERAEEALKRSEEAALLQARETDIIAEIGRIISSSLDIEEVYERFAEEVRKLIPFDRVLVNLIDPQEGTLTTDYAAGVEVAWRRKGVVFPLAGTVTEEVIRTGAPVLFHPESIEEVQNRFPGLVPGFEAGSRSRLSVPLIVRGEVIGSFTVWSKQVRAYGERDIRLAQSVANQIAGAIANARLFRERKWAEEALRASNELFWQFIRHSPIHAFIKEVTPTRSVVLQASDNYREMIGIPGGEMIGKTMSELFPAEFAAKITADDWATVSKGDVLRLDEELNGRSYTTIKFPILQGDKAFLAGYTIDITERKQAEERIRASLREKEVLLKEIHHRVKNNLQIISSLLFLQANQTDHPGAVSALQESRNRVRSMALIHERLYASPDLSRVGMGEYTRNLVSDLRHAHITEDGLVRLTLNLEDIPFGITEAIPCGLIINELVSNALKHAFPKGKEGEITIQLRRGNANRITLTVSDNGIGFPERVDFRKSPSLGLTLVNSLVEQLDGAIELDRRDGTAFTITFNVSG
jgi:PAS domain S-box-containing protein